MNSGLFREDIMNHFDFTHEYIGYVIDNSSFEEDFTIKVFIPELFGYEYQEYTQNNKKFSNISSKINNISFPINNISNLNELKIKSEIKSSEFLIARILIERHTFMSKEHFIFGNKPDIGKKVIVKFLNGNPLNCIYTNSLFLGDNENANIEIKDNGNIDDVITPGEGKVYWTIL